MRMKLVYVALIRYAEIGVKLGRTRRLFEERLARSIRCHLASSSLLLPLRLTPGRVYVEATSLDEARQAAVAAARAFGVHSATPAYSLPNDIDILESVIPKLFSEQLRRSHSFAIRARRVETYPLTSREVEKILGAAVRQAFPDVSVDLEHPELLIRVEIRARRAYIYLDDWVVDGPGGLPYGVEGTAAIPILECSDEELFAAWLVARRGAKLWLVAREACDEVQAFIEKWVPCGDARVETSAEPLTRVARLAEKLAALPVYARVIRLPNGLYTLSPLELSPREQVERLHRLYRRGPTPR